MVASRENFPLLTELLAEQQRLDTPVARFSAAHDVLAPGATALAPQLIPLTRPHPGAQYAFEVDLDSCTGCKSCVAACHSLNGLDDTETWRDVGLLVSPSRRQPFTQTVTTACHHCEDPACLNGCPVLAYEKDPVTGIVRHLDDQCIGCSYCILKCPYDVPKFSQRLGIVRKCDMCHGRLAEGEAPACVQACPTQAIRIVTVSVTPRAAMSASEWTSPVAASASEWTAEPLAHAGSYNSKPKTQNLKPPAFLPGAPDPAYTKPTTRYVTKRTLPEDVIAGDAATLRPQPPHWPLVIMLTLMPAAVGLSCAAAFLSLAPADFVTFLSLAPADFVTHYVTMAGSSSREFVTYNVTKAAWLAGGAGLAAAGFHLGQPLRAWRIFLGWRKSWLSREAMAFGAWFALASAALWLPLFAGPAAVAGVASLACSAMIYVDTRRRFWRATQTFPRFFGTGIVLAAAVVAPAVAALLVIAKLFWESQTFWDRSISARLQRGPLRRAVAARDFLGLGAAVLLVSAPAAVALPVLLTGELAERYLFFRAVDAPKMPGMPA